MKRMINKQFPLALTFTLFLTSALTGCSDEDFLTTQSDETKVLSFSIGTDMEEITSKASSEYRAWHSGDPTSFGAFGMYNQSLADIAKLFNNQQVTSSVTTVDDKEVVTWSYDPLKYWVDYTSYKTFDFFGYMPYVAGATLTQGGEGHENEYTLSYNATLSNAVLSDVANVPLICKEPVHKTKVGEVINFQMDQTLTGFSLQFKLGDKMANIRDFIIKEVKITGAATTLPTAGTVSRTYTYNPSGGTWTAGDIAWTGVTKNGEAIEYTVPYVNHGIAVAYTDADAVHGVDGGGTLRIGYSEPAETRQWGANFYAIPSAEFTPTISVKYDVVVVDEDTNDVTTRENIVSTIQFSNSYFDTYTAAGAIGQVNPIVVQIVPDYLYVLADADQRFSYIILE